MDAIDEKPGAINMLMDIALHLVPAKLRVLLSGWNGIVCLNLEMVAFFLDQLYLEARVPFADNHVRPNVRDAVADRGIVCIISISMSRERMELAANIGTGLADLFLCYL